MSMDISEETISKDFLAHVKEIYVSSRNFMKAISAEWHKGFSSDENKIFWKGCVVTSVFVFAAPSSCYNQKR